MPYFLIFMKSGSVFSTGASDMCNAALTFCMEWGQVVL